MIKITGSVGAGGNNLRQDVIIIQKALNKVTPTLNGKLLSVDGIYGKNTASAITVFQSKFAHMVKPDGRIDPNGRTIRNLAALQKTNSPILFSLGV